MTGPGDTQLPPEQVEALCRATRIERLSIGRAALAVTLVPPRLPQHPGS